MKKSEHIYNKFKSMFLIGDGENFAAVSLFDMVNVDTFYFVPGQTVCRTYAGIWSSLFIHFSIKFSQVFAKEVKDFQKSDRDKKHKEGDPPTREKKEDKENLMETGWFILQQ